MSKRGYNILITFLLLSLVGMWPAAGQETVIGFFEGQSLGNNSGSGAIGLTGWALADSGIRKVVIQVDGLDVGQAFYGHHRPDVETLNPGFSDSANAGFSYALNSTDFPNGTHVVRARVETNDGTLRSLPVGQSIFFNNNTSILVPFGKIERPRRNQELYGTCDLNDSDRIYTVVSGWALDLGVEIGDAGIGYVELLIDGAIVGNTRTGCYFDLDVGGFNTCYGLPRLDIERTYPFAIDAHSPGFRFVMDVGFLINFGWLQGQHTLTIRAGDIDKQVANIDEIPVVFLCEENRPNEGSFGDIELPRLGAIVDDDVLVRGWTVDIDGVREVDVWVDGIHVGQAVMGVDTRPRVAQNFAGYPDANAPVFALTFDSTAFSDGFHEVQVVVTDEWGKETTIGERTFYVDNALND